VFLTRWFGVTESDVDRERVREKADIEMIVEKSLLMQANAAAQQHRPLCRGTHAKGVCARAQFEIFDLTAGSGHALAARLAKGIFSKPGVYPAVLRFANADPASSLISSPMSDHCPSRSILLGKARTLAVRISRCKMQRPCPSTTPQLFWRP